MRHWLLVMGIALLGIGTECSAVAADASDDDEYEEVVVKRKKKRTKVQQEASAAATAVSTPVAAAAVVVPAVVAVPVVSAVATAAPVVQEEEEEPLPEPPAADAAEPRRLVRYFCKTWKDKDYERLWWAMSKSYRKKVSLKKFKKLFEDDAELNGGLLDENILEASKTRDGNEGVKVELIFKFPKAKHKFVTAVAERQSGGAFRLIESPIIPINLDDL